MPTSHTAADLHALARNLENRFMRQAFGGIWFWRFAVVRPHDDTQMLTACHVAGDGHDQHLQLELQLCSGQGQAAVLQIWSPAGLEIDSRGLRLKHASTLRFGPATAKAVDAHRYRLSTPRGEGDFEIEGAPALFLEI